MSAVSFLARMTVKEGREEDFKRYAKELEKNVHANEPGTTYYRFFSLREPRQYAVMESFVDAAAEDKHMNTDYFAEIAPHLLDCLEGDPGYVREFLDPM